MCLLVDDDLTSEPTLCHMSFMYAFAHQDIQEDTATDSKTGTAEKVPVKRKIAASIDLIGMLGTDCSGEIRLALHVPSSSCARKQEHRHYCQDANVHSTYCSSDLRTAAKKRRVSP